MVHVAVTLKVVEVSDVLCVQFGTLHLPPLSYVSGYQKTKQINLQPLVDGFICLRAPGDAKK